MINSQLDKFNLNIARGVDDQNGEVFYALICIRENNISKLSSIYSPEQLEVLKAALELCITKNGRFASKKIVKMMLNKNVKFPVINDIYNTIDEFVREKYFQPHGLYYYPLPRTLIEFNVYYRTYYKDLIRECVLCKQICLRPVTCEHCSTFLHKICADKYYVDQDRCVGCGNQFEHNESIDSVESQNGVNSLNNESNSDVESDQEMNTDEHNIEVAQTETS